MHRGKIFGEQQSRRLKVKEIKADYLVCIQTNALSGEDQLEINVAKPYNLRATSYHGRTIEFKNWNKGTTVTVSYTAHESSDYNSRVADFNADAEVCSKGVHLELLYPPYQQGDYIVASMNVSANIGDKAPWDDGVDVIYLDENREGRHWKDDCGSGGGGGSVWV